MRLTTGFILTSLGISSQFACGFSLKPHNANHNPLHTITSLNKDRKSPLVQVLGRGTRTYTYTHQGLISSTATTTTIPANSNSIAMRGGATMNAAAVSGGASGDDSASYKLLNSVASLWAAGGVVMILGKSIKRILPIALEPFDGVAAPLSTFQLG